MAVKKATAPDKLNQLPKVGTWEEGQEPTHIELIQGLRTFVSMASCWLDRDVERRGADLAQAKNLRDILKLLENARELQSCQTRILWATMFRDEVAVSLGATVKTDADGNRLVDREEKSNKLPNQLLGLWYGMAGMFIDAKNRDRLIETIRTGFWNYTWFALGQARNLSVAAAQEYVVDARALVADIKKTKGITMGASELASCIVVKILVDEDGDNWIDGVNPGGPSDEPEAAEARFSRYLKLVRHPDRPQTNDAASGRFGPDSIDLGEFFGARRTTVAATNPRQWAAAKFIADACLGSDELAGQVAVSDRGYPSMWALAARGAGAHRTPGEAKSPELCDLLSSVEDALGISDDREHAESESAAEHGAPWTPTIMTSVTAADSDEPRE